MKKIMLIGAMLSALIACSDETTETNQSGTVTRRLQGRCRRRACSVCGGFQYAYLNCKCKIGEDFLLTVDRLV